MPYKNIQYKIPREHDKRVKITNEQKELIKRMYYDQGMAQRAIERELKVSRRAISFILFPERLEKCKMQFAERRKDGRYYNKDVWREAMRKHRKHKQSLFLTNQLTSPSALN